MRVRDNRVLRDNAVYCSEFLDRPPPLSLRVSHQQNRGIAGTSARDSEALSLILFYYGVYTLKAFLQGIDSFWGEVLRHLFES